MSSVIGRKLTTNIHLRSLEYVDDIYNFQEVQCIFVSVGVIDQPNDNGPKNDCTFCWMGVRGPDVGPELLCGGYASGAME